VNLVVPLVWQSTMKDAREVAVLACVASHCNDFGEGCFAGIPRLAALARCSHSTTQRVLKKLEADGWLKAERGNGRGNFTFYTVNVDQLKGCQDETLLPRSKRVSSVQERVSSVQKKGVKCATPLLKGSIEASKKQHTPHSPPQAGESCLPENLPANRDAVDPEIEAAMVEACDALGIVKRRHRLRIGAVIRLEAQRAGESPPGVAARMLRSFRRQSEAKKRGELVSIYGVMNFFELGIWKDEGRWHWDEQALKLQAVARVGSP
jgi:hypothetical protein